MSRKKSAKLIEPQDEPFRTKTKEEFLKIMYSHLNRQEEMANAKWEVAKAMEDSDELKLNINRATKKENTDLVEYNKQVQAVGQTIALIMRIQKSDLPTEKGDLIEEEGNSEEELV